jgi:hypothetical protein
MATRSRSLVDRLLRRRASEADVAKLNELLDYSQGDWDGKDLASLSKINMATNSTQSKSGANTPVSYSLLREISQKSEVVNAILRRAVDDTLANGYEFILPEDSTTGDETQLKKVRDFFRNPNPDDVGNEWLETLLWDLILFGDAYLELEGSDDSSSDDGKDWNYGGDLQAIWPVEAESMKIIPAQQIPKPPAMAYIQSMNRDERKFSANKILHIAKFKQGRGYGSSPLIPLLEVITGQLNLSNYLNALYTGTLPKTILNVGDISNNEMKAMLGLIEQQLAGGKSPFGLIAINGGAGFTMHRLIDSTREGAQLDLLYYYREEICAVFGIPPMKLGWVQTGKLANPEQQLDAWYDVVESYHHRVSSLINNRILPLLEITDWKFKFISIRPKQDAQRSETFNNNANAISTLRQEATISINEARNILGLEAITSEEAEDPFYISPSLQINQPGAFDGSDEGPLPSEPEVPAALRLLDLFPPIASPEDEGKQAGNSPWFDEFSDVEISDEDRTILMSKRIADRDVFDEIESEGTENLLNEFELNQSLFVERLLAGYNNRFRDTEVMVGKDIGPGDLNWSVNFLDEKLTELLDMNTVSAGVTSQAGYESTLATMNAGVGITIGFNAADAAVLSFWQRRWVLPALRNTVNAYRSRVIGVFDRMTTNGQNWKWASGEMRRLIDPTGDKYPKGFYDRIARTETRRVVETAHISGLTQAGFNFMQRLVEVDTQTDKDLCAPFEDSIYKISEASGVVPAHPNCRCTMIPHAGEPANVVTDPLKPPLAMPPDEDF